MHVPDPVVILTLPRSYGSLALAMLGQHPQMFSLLETQLFELDSMEEWLWRFGGRQHDGDGLRRVVAEVIFGHQCELTIQDAIQWLQERSTWEPGDILWALADRLAPLIMVEKTPIEKEFPGEISAALKRRLNAFPETRFLHVVRHPFTYCRSQLRHLESMRQSSHPWRMAKRYRMLMDSDSYPPVLDPQVLWGSVNASIVSFVRKLPPNRWMRIRGEDLVTEPATTARRIAEWLGIRADDRAIEEMLHPERSPFAFIGPPNAMFGADPTFLREPWLRNGAPDLPPIESELPWRSDGQLFKPQVRQMAYSFGYAS